MTPQEANRIIAEYMGWIGLDNHTLNNEANFISLDALVPVWEKLGNTIAFEGLLHRKRISRFDIIKNDRISHTDKCTIKEAAAIATAKAIMELEK